MAKHKISKRLKAQIDAKRARKRIAPVTTEEFDAALQQIIDEECTAEVLLSIPGIYEVLSEHYNNDAISLALAKREDS